MNLQDYLIDQTGLDWQSLLEEWRWLLPSKFRVLLLTRTGDVFVVLPDDSVHLLDVGAGTLSQVAESQDEFTARIEDPAVANDWLMISIVDDLVASGVMLAVGQCYSFRQLPIVGGTYTAENRMAFSIREHFGAWGSVQRQISELPDGAEIIIKPLA